MKSPPVFRKSPWGILGGFLTGRLTKKFPALFRKKFSEKFPVRIFPEMPGNFRKSFLTNFVEKVSHNFFEKKSYPKFCELQIFTNLGKGACINHTENFQGKYALRRLYICIHV